MNEKDIIKIIEKLRQKTIQINKEKQKELEEKQ